MPTTKNVIAMPDANPATNSPAGKPLSIVPDVGNSSFTYGSSITTCTYHKRQDGFFVSICMCVYVVVLCM